jgi:hypothetical protein
VTRVVRCPPGTRGIASRRSRRARALGPRGTRAGILGATLRCRCSDQNATALEASSAAARARLCGMSSTGR